jgi:hydrogenase maturation protease
VKTLILGMGNPILSDDGVGLHVARALEGRFAEMDVRTCALIGLGLLDIVADFDRVFVIDAVQDSNRQQGTVVKLVAGQGALHLFSSHGMHFFEILQMGKDAGIAVPEVAGIYGVVIGPECLFGEELSPLLARRQARIVKQIAEDIGRG